MFNLSRKEIFFGGILTFSFFMTIFFFYTYQIFRSPNLQVEKEAMYLYIPKGTDFKQLLDIMEKEKIIADKISFAFLSKTLSYQKNVKSGRYLIESNMNNFNAIRMLKAGVQSPIKFTFNNLRTKEDFAEKASEWLIFEEEDLLKLLNDTSFVKKYERDTTTILTIFLPNTYEVYWNTSAKSFVERMHSEYKKFWNKSRLAKAKALNLSPTEVSILASIVQAETNQPTEKPRVAGVYLNRLQKNMKLEADPTLVFAVGDFTIQRVLNRHKQVESPYNTYLYEGLPPGPINIPSPQSIDAVLNYEKHDYLFFCAKADFSGFHAFAKTYNEHLKNARLFQTALDMKGIK